jgi:sulfopyruvate decarboxylase subunit beta
MMKRDDCFRALAHHVTDEIVLPVFASAFDWIEVAPRALNYYWFGAMGIASSHGLGLALGRPDKRVIVLDGDGSLLMNLGALVTIHFVCQNDHYEVIDNEPVPHAGKVDFAGLARAAGYRHAYDFAELSDFEAKIAGVLKQDGPVFAALHIEKGALAPQLNYRRLDEPSLRTDFRAALRV